MLGLMMGYTIRMVLVHVGFLRVVDANGRGPCVSRGLLGAVLGAGEAPGNCTCKLGVRLVMGLVHVGFLRAAG